MLSNMPADEARAFEERYITCSVCTTILEETGRYVLPMEEAAHGVRRSADNTGISGS